jgi:hypothetical protein
MPTSNNEDKMDSRITVESFWWLNHILVKTAITIILLSAGAWGKWVTTAVMDGNSAMSKITERLARIEQKLDDHFRSDDAKRHNP